MNQRIYDDLLAKVQGWPTNGLNGLLLEEEINANFRAGQYNKEQEEELIRILRQRVDQAVICPECSKIDKECKCYEAEEADYDKFLRSLPR